MYCRHTGTKASQTAGIVPSVGPFFCVLAAESVLLQSRISAARRVLSVRPSSCRGGSCGSRRVSTGILRAFRQGGGTCGRSNRRSGRRWLDAYGVATGLRHRARGSGAAGIFYFYIDISDGTRNSPSNPGAPGRFCRCLRNRRGRCKSDGRDRSSVAAGVNVRLPADLTATAEYLRVTAAGVISAPAALSIQ